MGMDIFASLPYDLRVDIFCAERVIMCYILQKGTCKL